MRAMKDSGVEWIGEIPEGWSICRLKDYASIQNGQDHKAVISDDGLYPVIGSGGQFSSASAYLYDSESVLLGRKGTINKPMYINKPFWTVDTMYYTQIKDNANARYFFYLCTLIAFDYYQFGSAVPSMTQRDLNNVQFPCPEVQIQEQIATFLDAKCAHIDAIIEKQQQVIEKLKAYKQSVITEAVTTGLDPTVPMKDSGVEWIGMVPEHWEIVPLKKQLDSIIDYRGKTPTKSIEGVFLVTARNIKNGIIDYSLSQEYIEESEYEITMRRGKPTIGDVLFTTEAPLGEVANVDREDIALAQRIIKFKVQRSILDPYFLKYWLMSSGLQYYLQTLSTGSTAAGIKSSKLFMLLLVLPSLKTQQEIVHNLDNQSKQISLMIEKKQILVDKISTYKKSLIYEAVTGKMEV